MEPYSIHPNPAKEHVVLAPGREEIRCKHEAAAQRLCSLLNSMASGELPRGADWYFIHTGVDKGHMICTPDGGVIECKHREAAQYACGMLNGFVTMKYVKASLEFEEAKSAIPGLHSADQVGEGVWILGGLEPQHPAVYQRRVPPGVAEYSYWDGTRWCTGGMSPQVALSHKHWPSSYQSFDWRALL